MDRGYEAPKVVPLGSVHEVTLGVAVTSSDGSMGVSVTVPDPLNT